MKNTDNQSVKEPKTKTKKENDINETDNSTENTTAETDNVTVEEEAVVVEESVDTADVWKDKYMRLSAEFDNFRKRTVKEKMDLIEMGGERVLKAIISITDDFERALKAMGDGPEKEGMELINKKFMEALSAEGVTTIDALNQPLNTDFHDAIAKFAAPSPELVGSVIDVVQTGYMLKDKVLRFSKVVVGE